MSVKLRPYQVASIEAIRAAIRSGKRRVMLTVPTGGGKTLTAASVIISALAKGKRCLFVAHRKELIDQTVAAFSRLGVTSVGVIRAQDRRRDSSQPIQVASIQTIARRLQPDYDLVFVDEAHRSNATTYTKHVFERHAAAVIIGLSATPCRADGRPLGTHFDELIVGARYSELIEGGHIVAPLVYSTPVLPDMSTVRTSGGDFNQEDLEAAVNRGALIGDLVAQWSKHPRQRTVVFAVSVAHSLAIVDQFKGAGVKAEHLDGTTPEAERSAILARLEAGTTELVSNVGVLCEGWDMPSCKTLILARPTKSLGLYMQMAGRTLRPWRDVPSLVLDHGGNVDRHGLPHEDREWSLTKKAKKGDGTPPVKACPACFAFIAACAKNCPHCGHVFVVATPKEAEPIIVDLALRTLDGDDAKLNFFRATYKRARDRGYKAGYVVHVYRERFGVDPEPKWFAALRSDYRSDAEWKARVAAKQAAKREEESAA
jgi:DNA repair protein RadD